MKDYIHAFVTILALINPAICAQMFAECTANTPVAEKGKVAVRVVFTIGFVLLLAALAGTSILNVFGISLDAFSCAGGGILVWIGVSMLKSAQESSKTQSVDNSRSPSSLTPLILFAASPGTITGVITVSSSHKHQFLPYTAIFGVTAALMVLALVLFASERWSGNQRKPSTGSKMVTSYMGVIVIAMGVQFILSGIKAFMA